VVVNAEIDEEVEFRLFATSANSARNDIQIFRIHSPDRSNEPPGFVIARRIESYYFQESLSPEKQEELATVALSGSEVLVNSKSAWPGCSLPWRVTRIETDGMISSSQLPADTQPQSADTKSRNSRIGKKARIVNRKRLAAEREQAEKRAQQDVEKQIAEREKKTRRNREKQLKKREKEKLKKAGGAFTAEPS
jgi:hypothetical protein